MLEIGRVLDDVKSLYKETTGREWNREDIPRYPFPEGAEQSSYLEREVNYLNNVIQGRGLVATPTAQPRWLPPIEMSEVGKTLLIEVELPGLKRSDIRLSLRNGFLHLRAERPQSTEERSRLLLTTERPYGVFERQIWLPVQITPESLRARLHDGVLIVEATKKEPEIKRGREIQIL